ncbi:MAG TPA: M28 family peptidase [Thermomicrobiaceae bacterium]|nr:M28 family peptidase [Thermomicrobiaceae bacterium]
MTSQDQDAPSPPVDPDDIAMLAEEIGPRPPGSPQERRAVELVQERLRAIGVPSATLPVRTARRAAPVYTVLLALDALGVPLAFYSASFGFIVSLIALILLALELATFPFLSRLGRDERSSNLLGIIPARSGTPEGQPRRLVIASAHLDTARGVARHELGGQLYPLALAVLAAAVLTPLALLLVALTGATVFRALAGLGFVVQGVAVVALAGQLARGRPSAGADDNASGVAALLGAARGLEAERPEEVETWLLFTSGADDGRTGMVQFLSENQFDPASTFFIDVDRVGGAQLCFTRGEGLVAPLHSAGRLTALAEEAAAAHPEWAVGATVSRWPGNQFATLIRGYPAIAITGCGIQRWRGAADSVNTVAIESVAQAAELVTGIIRRLDGGAQPGTTGAAEIWQPAPETAPPAEAETDAEATSEEAMGERATEQ